MKHFESSKIINTSAGTAIPDGYYGLGRIFAGTDCRFAKLSTAVEACIQLSYFFQQLHDSGYCFSNVTHDNFLFDTQTGDLLVRDDGNIVPDGMNLKVLQQHRYVSPEIVLGDGKTAQSARSERYSLSVFIFMILFGGHPLEGQRALVPALTWDTSKKIYGSEPVFIFDPDNDSNRPSAVIHAKTIKRWQILPPYIKDICVRAFSKSALSDSSLQPCESEWIDTLTHLKKDAEGAKKDENK